MRQKFEILVQRKTNSPVFGLPGSPFQPYDAAMAKKREDFKREEEERAKRFPEQAKARWSTNPNTYLNLLLLVLVLLLIAVLW